MYIPQRVITIVVFGTWYYFDKDGCEAFIIMGILLGIVLGLLFGIFIGGMYILSLF